MYAAFSRSALTGLTVGLALPREEVDGPIRRILWILAGAWVVILGVGAGLGLALGQVIVRAMRGASQAAMALARGEAVSPAPSRITEIDELSTGLRLAAQTLEARNRERDEASRLKDEFLMTVSHELRTPLTAIYGWARMLSTGQIRDAQRPRAIDAIERNAAALQQLVNDLLDVSRVVSGKLRLDVEAVSLPDVVGAAIDTIRPAAHAKNISVVTTTDAGDLLVSGDAGRLQQVIWNLLSNAVRFTPAGGRIEIALGRAADGIEIVVRDTGPGVDAGISPARLRALPSGRGRHHARARRPRPGLRDRPAPGGAARRDGGGDEQPPGAGRDVPHRAARAAGRARRGSERRAGGRDGRHDADGRAHRRRPRAGRRRRHERARAAGGDSRERRRRSARRGVGRGRADDSRALDAGRRCSRTSRCRARMATG